VRQQYSEVQKPLHKFIRKSTNYGLSLTGEPVCPTDKARLRPRLDISNTWPQTWVISFRVAKTAMNGNGAETKEKTTERCVYAMSMPII